MAWTIEYDEEAVRDLKKLDRQVQREILDHIEQRIGRAEDPLVRQAASSQQIWVMAISRARLSNRLPIPAGQAHRAGRGRRPPQHRLRGLASNVDQCGKAWATTEF